MTEDQKEHQNDCREEQPDKPLGEPKDKPLSEPRDEPQPDCSQGIAIDLKEYVQKEILPQYQHFDAAHQQDHVQMVIRQAMELARLINQGRVVVEGVTSVSLPMVYVAAACHDLGLSVDRKTHHLHSGNIVRQDKRLLQWFTPEDIEIIAQAVEDHRASSKTTPRSIYGKIVSEADRNIIAESIVLRTVQYGLDNYAGLDRQGQWERTIEHLKNKYGPGGYLRLWFSDGANFKRLKKLQELISDDPSTLRSMFDQAYDREMAARNHPHDRDSNVNEDESNGPTGGLA